MTKHRVKIEYCTACNWMIRAAWMAQELLQTFQDELSEVTLAPGTGGVFDIYLDGEMLFSRKAHERFPEIKELKKLVRDVVSPERNLGHIEKS